MGPFDRWPSPGGGFEHFYGFIETNQYAPAIYDGTVPVEPDRSPEEGTTSRKTSPTGLSNGSASRRR